MVKQFCSRKHLLRGAAPIFDMSLLCGAAPIFDISVVTNACLPTSFVANDASCGSQGSHTIDYGSDPAPMDLLDPNPIDFASSQLLDSIDFALPPPCVPGRDGQYTLRCI